MSSPSLGAASRSANNSRTGDVPAAKAPSMIARSVPSRTSPAPARPPIKAETASIMIDLPAPVSPVSTLRPGPNSISIRPARAKSCM